MSDQHSPHGDESDLDPPEAGDEHAAEVPAEATGPPADPADAADDASFTTGDDQVDRAVGRLEELDGLDLDGHVDVYEDIHRRLQESLDDGGPEPS